MKPKGTKDKSEEPAFATNRKARHHYDILETFEAGLELKGTEIKAIRQLTQKRLTIVALKLYPVHGLAKVEIALARGKRVFEKRDRIRSEELNREIRRTMRSRQQR
ncbi:MAG: SsrA-binding protein [Candidatus Omnitrophica bacterium]|nr:SsrA-binding protein [Candidatus Omnitrophota bacterium]